MDYYSEGYQAFHDLALESDCPYPVKTYMYIDRNDEPAREWLNGWHMASCEEWG